MVTRFVLSRSGCLRPALTTVSRIRPTAAISSRPAGQDPCCRWNVLLRSCLRFYAVGTVEGMVTVASHVVRYQVDESTVVGFEVEPGSGWQQAGVREVAGRVREAVEPAIEAAKVVLEKVKVAKPDEVKVKFGIKVTGEAKWIVARAAAEGSFEVTLTWSPSEEQAAPTTPDLPAAAS